MLVPSNRFEVLECEAALEAVAESHQDSEDPVVGGYDVLAQHVLGMACAAPFAADSLYDEVRRAWPYRDLPRGQFDRVLEFVATGGYALKAYERQGYEVFGQLPEFPKSRTRSFLKKILPPG